MAKPRLKVPHVFVLLAGVILVCSALTHVVPSGEYERRTVEVGGRERTLLVPGTFRQLDKHYDTGNLLLGLEPEDAGDKATPVGLHGFLTAIPRGLEKQADIIFFIFIVGGVFGILQRTGVINAGLARLVSRFGGSGPALTIVLMVVLSIGGSTLGMGEEFIPLVPVFLLVSRRLGYDRIYGLALVLVAAEVGFAASTTNPFTVCVAQGIAELPLYSGMPLRIALWACAITVAILYTLRYGRRVMADPSASYAPDEDFEIEEEDVGPFTGRHAAILISSTLIFAGILVATNLYGWWMNDMIGGFLLMGIVAAAIARLPLDDTVSAFVGGMRDMVVAALVVGFARGIEVVLSDGQIMDTIVHGAASLLLHVPKYVAAVGMLLFESTLNLLVPSGSGQAAVTVPLMAPLSDIIGLSRQTAVLAFTCGDGFSNTIIPTSGIVMAMLALARVPYGRWLRFMLPLWALLMGVSAVFLTIAVLIDYS